MTAHLNTALLVLGIATASLLSTVAPEDSRVEQATQDTVADRAAEQGEVLAEIRFQEARHAVR